MSQTCFLPLQPFLHFIPTYKRERPLKVFNHLILLLEKYFELILSFVELTTSKMHFRLAIVAGVLLGNDERVIKNRSADAEKVNALPTNRQTDRRND